MAWQFQAPPGWDVPAAFTPPSGWVPAPGWPPAPPGWQFWAWAPPGPAGAPETPASAVAPATRDGSAVVAAATAAPPTDSPPHPAAPGPVHEGWWTRHREHVAQEHAAHAAAQRAATAAAEQARLDEQARLAAAAAAGSGGLQDGLALRADEAVVWQGAAALVETVRTPGHYVGGSQGISVPVVAGVRYRVGSMRGHYVPGPEVRSPVDRGDVVVTTRRVVFRGAKDTREWAFEKMLGVDTSSDDAVVMIHVSNRQKVSGLSVGHTGPAFVDALGLAVAIHQHGAATVAAQTAAAAAAHRAAAG